MSKYFFRYMRGEHLTGFYLRTLQIVAEKTLGKWKSTGLYSDYTNTPKYWLQYLLRFVFPDAEVSEEVYQENQLKYIKQKEIYDLGVLSGMADVRGLSATPHGFMHLSESKIIDNQQVSHSMLYNQKTAELEYPAGYNPQEDIITLANYPTGNLRAGLTDSSAGVTPAGYVYSTDVDVFNQSIPGTIQEDNLHASAPVTQASFQLLYGNLITPLYEPFLFSQNVPTTIYLRLLEIHNYIRYNGISLKILFDFSEIVGITDSNINLFGNGFTLTQNANGYYTLTYTFDTSANEYTLRHNMWVYFMTTNYPWIALNKVEVN